jgi:ribokinase
MKDSKYIVSIGTVCIDDYIKSSNWPKLGDKALAEFKGYEVGGMPYNAACVVSSTGIKTYMLDVIGREFRDIIIEDIDENNIDKSLITYDDHKTMRTIIVNSQGERVIFVLDEDKKPEINLTGEQVDILSKADYLYSNIPEVNRIINGKNILKDLRKKGVKIFYDVEKTMLKDEYNIEFFMENADYISFNVEGYKELIKIKSQEFIDKLIDNNTKIIITKGKNGCEFLSKDTIIELEGIERKTLDTTGAGDTFNGIFISSLIKGAKYKEALIKANEIASLSTEYYGVNKKIGKLLK